MESRRMTTKPNPEKEAECIHRILAGEKHLFHELIRPCERGIYFLLVSLLRNEAEAEDAAQETVLKIYRNLHLFRGEAQFRTWALSIARNEGLSRLRKAENRREDSLDALSEGQAGDFTPSILTSWREVPSEALERKELGALLRQAIEGLPEIYRNVVLLRDIEEMDVRETAAALGITRERSKGSVAPRTGAAAAEPGTATEGVCAQTGQAVGVGKMRIDCKHVLGTHLRLHRRRCGRGPARGNRPASGDLRNLLGGAGLDTERGGPGGRRSRLRSARWIQPSACMKG